MSEEQPPKEPPKDAKQKDEFPEFGVDLNTVGPSGKPLNWYRWAAWFAAKIWESRVLPEQVDRPNKAFAILCKGDELGLPAFAAWTWIYMTKNGRLAIMSKGALAVVQSKPTFGGYKEWLENEGTPDMKAVAAAQRKGMPEATIKEFSLRDAEAAGLLKKKRNQRGDEYEGPWQAFLKDMLYSRVRGRVLDIAFAAELGGIAVEGAAEDADQMEDQHAGATAGARHRGADNRPFTLLPGGAEQKALPAPRAVDPLAEALAGKRLETVGRPAPQPVPSQAHVETELRKVGDVQFIDPAAVTVVESMPPEVAAQIAANVDAIFGPSVSGPPPAAQPSAGTPPERVPVRDRQETTRSEGPAGGGGVAPTTCPRCGHGLNAMGGCDLCGFPSAVDLR